MATGQAKYMIPEIERRWLVDPTILPDLSPFPKIAITDLYLLAEPIRLRKMESPDKTVWKLGRKAPGGRWESTVSFYLPEDAYLKLLDLPGWLVTKERIRLPQGSLDLYCGEPLIFEQEFESEGAADQFIPPDWCTQEVTGHPEWSGFSLAQKHGTLSGA